MAKIYTITEAEGCVNTETEGSTPYQPVYTGTWQTDRYNLYWGPVMTLNLKTEISLGSEWAWSCSVAFEIWQSTDMP